MSGMGDGASTGGVFVVQADNARRKTARRENTLKSRRQALMNPP